MVDLQTYRLRIGGAPSLVAKILGRKAKLLKFSETKENQEDFELSSTDMLRVIRVVMLLLCYISTHVQEPLPFPDVAPVFSVLTWGQEVLASSLHSAYLRWDPMVGAVHFISMLLVMAGIESNPGPVSKDDREK